jgi:hypothetical protein
MTEWLLPALKAILPHVGTIIKTTSPVFTRKTNEASQQIAELQAAATEHAANIRELATQLQTTVTAIEQAAAVAEANMRRLFVVSVSAAIVSLVALGLSLAVVLSR